MGGLKTTKTLSVQKKLPHFIVLAPKNGSSLLPIIWDALSLPVEVLQHLSFCMCGCCSSAPDFIIMV